GSERLRKDCPLPGVACAISRDVNIYTPNPFDRPEADRFLSENERLLCGPENVEVYWQSPKGNINPPQSEEKEGNPSQTQAGNPPQYAGGDYKLTKELKQARNVAPQQNALANFDNVSKAATSEAE